MAKRSGPFVFTDPESLIDKIAKNMPALPYMGAQIFSHLPLPNHSGYHTMFPKLEHPPQAEWQEIHAAADKQVGPLTVAIQHAVSTLKAAIPEELTNDGQIDLTAFEGALYEAAKKHIEAAFLEALGVAAHHLPVSMPSLYEGKTASEILADISQGPSHLFIEPLPDHYGKLEQGDEIKFVGNGYTQNINHLAGKIGTVAVGAKSEDPASGIIFAVHGDTAFHAVPQNSVEPHGPTIAKLQGAAGGGPAHYPAGTPGGKGGQFMPGHGVSETGDGGPTQLTHKTQAAFATKKAYLQHLHAVGHSAAEIKKHTGYDFAMVYGAIADAKKKGIEQGSQKPSEPVYIGKVGDTVDYHGSMGDISGQVVKVTPTHAHIAVPDNNNDVAVVPHGSYTKGHRPLEPEPPKEKTQADFKTKSAYLQYLHGEMGLTAKEIIAKTGADFAAAYAAVKKVKDLKAQQAATPFAMPVVPPVSHGPTLSPLPEHDTTFGDLGNIGAHKVPLGTKVEIPTTVTTFGGGSAITGVVTNHEPDGTPIITWSNGSQQTLGVGASWDQVIVKGSKGSAAPKANTPVVPTDGNPFTVEMPPHVMTAFLAASSDTQNAYHDVATAVTGMLEGHPGDHGANLKQGLSELVYSITGPNGSPAGSTVYQHAKAGLEAVTGMPVHHIATADPSAIEDAVESKIMEQMQAIGPSAPAATPAPAPKPAAVAPAPKIAMPPLAPLMGTEHIGNLKKGDQVLILDHWNKDYIGKSATVIKGNAGPGNIAVNVPGVHISPYQGLTISQKNVAPMGPTVEKIQKLVQKQQYAAAKAADPNVLAKSAQLPDLAADYHVGKLKAGDQVFMVGSPTSAFGSALKGKTGTVTKGSTSKWANVSVHFDDAHGVGTAQASTLPQEYVVPVGATKLKLQQQQLKEAKKNGTASSLPPPPDPNGPKVVSTLATIKSGPVHAGDVLVNPTGIEYQVHGPGGTAGAVMISAVSAGPTGPKIDYHISIHADKWTHKVAPGTASAASKGAPVSHVSTGPVYAGDVLQAPNGEKFHVHGPGSAADSVHISKLSDGSDYDNIHHTIIEKWTHVGTSTGTGAGLTPPTPPATPSVAKPAAASDMPKTFPYKETEMVKTSEGGTLGGGHAKTVYTAPDGRKWLFKPDATSGVAENVSYAVMRELGVTAPHSYQVTMDGHTGSMQRMHADVAVGKVPFEAIPALSASQHAEIQQHHVIDWLLSQHDTNHGALLLAKTGEVLAVDKGQAFKFLGHDKLDWNYEPNGDGTVYKKLFGEYIKGTVDLDKRAVLGPNGIVSKIEAMPDARYAELLKPYAEHQAKGGANGAGLPAADFTKQALARKQSLRADFEDYYKRIASDRAKATAYGAPASAAPLDKLGAVTPIDTVHAGKVADHGWAGAHIALAGKDFENGSLLSYTLNHIAPGATPSKGAVQSKTLVIEGKVRPEIEAALLTALGNPKVAQAKTPSATPSDPYWGTALTVIKHVGAHLTPGSQHFDDTLTPAKVAGLKTIANNVHAVLNSATASPEEKDSAAHYKAIIENLTGHPVSAIASGTNEELAQKLKAAYSVDKYKPGTFAEFVPKPKATTVAAPTAAQIKAIPISPYILNRQLVNGELYTNGTKVPQTGHTAFEVPLGGGYKAVYTANGDNNPLGTQGKLQILRENFDGTPEQIKDTVAQLQKLGIKPELATAKQNELMYLRKMGRVEEMDLKSPAYKAAISDHIAAHAKDATNPSVDEEIAAHHAFWNKKLGVADVTQLPGYEPAPQYDSVVVGDKVVRGAHPFWNRFDLSDDDIRTQMAGTHIKHDYHDGTTWSNINAITGGNMQLVSQEERHRMGIFNPKQNMSGEAGAKKDQENGGSSYVFTRIYNSKQGAIVLDHSLLRRLDNVASAGDPFGKVDQNHIAKEAKSTPAGWKQIMNGNELDIKHGVSLIDYATRIESGGHKDAIVAAFKKVGVTHIRGVPVEQVVV